MNDRLSFPKAPWSAALVVAALTVLAQLPSAFTPFGGDDVYVLDNLSSPDWGNRLFAFNLDAPAAEYMPWWAGLVVQRRFIRVPACLLLWLERVLFGRGASLYHCVTLGLVAASCALLAMSAARWLTWSAAVGIALIPGLHPATAEVVSALNCQPLAVAGFSSVLTVLAWAQMRLRNSPVWALAAVALCGLAVSSYEAAIALPFALILGDLLLWRRPATAVRRWAPYAATVAIAAAEAVFSTWMRRGLVAPDTTPLRPLSEIALSLRLDAVAYEFKALGLLNPSDPAAYWGQNLFGEPVSIALAIALVAGLAWALRRERVGWLGLGTFGLLLAAPLLTRATVSRFNLPTLRQVYLPVLLGAPLVASALARRQLPPWAGVAGLGWLVLLAVEADVSGRFREAVRQRLAQQASVVSALRGVPQGWTVVGVGDRTCGFASSYVWSGPAVLGIPEDAEERAPGLVAVDSHTLLVRAPEALAIVTKLDVASRTVGPNRGPAWTDRVPPPLVTRGRQRIHGATVAVDERSRSGIRSLRYRFDRPLSELVFLHYRGCAPVERLWPAPAGAARAPAATPAGRTETSGR